MWNCKTSSMCLDLRRCILYPGVHFCVSWCKLLFVSLEFYMKYVPCCHLLTPFHRRNPAWACRLLRLTPVSILLVCHMTIMDRLKTSMCDTGAIQVLRNARGGGWVYAQALRSVTRGWGGVRQRYVTSFFC